MEKSPGPADVKRSEITLSRGTTGLGFNIRGGVDNPHIQGDTGIFVTKVRENGAAYIDGRLKEGDKILEINGKSLVGVTHEEAVQCFTRAKEEVKLMVDHGAQARILKQKEEQQKDNKKGQANQSNTLIYVGIVAVVGLVGFLVYKRHDLGKIFKK